MKLSSERLRKIVLEEAKKLSDELQGTPVKGAEPAKEVDAKDLANTVDSVVDWCAAAKIKEAALIVKAKQLRERREKLMSSLKRK